MVNFASSHMGDKLDWLEDFDTALINARQYDRRQLQACSGRELTVHSHQGACHVYACAYTLARTRTTRSAAATARGGTFVVRLSTQTEDGGRSLIPRSAPHLHNSDKMRRVCHQWQENPFEATKGHC